MNILVQSYKISSKTELVKILSIKVYKRYYLSNQLTAVLRYTPKPHLLKRIKNLVKIPRRFMMSSRCMYAARSLYHAATLISNSNTINNFNKENTSPFVTDIVKYTLDDTKGIVQHKTAILKHLSNQKFYNENFYEPFIDEIKSTIVKYEPHVLVDFRTLNELKTLELYLKQNSKDIAWVYATSDARPATFPGAHQSNPDFWVYIDKAFGFHAKATYQDDKSGMDMFKHSSKGSIGVAYYDADGKNIQMTSRAIDANFLIEYNELRIKKLGMALTLDNISEDPMVLTVLSKARLLQKQMKGQSFDKMSNIHNEIQTLLWNEIQCHPQFSQSVSFVFLKQLINHPQSAEEIHFAKNFQSKLQYNKMYDMNVRGDFNDLYKAFIYAGKQMDPLFTKKLYYLHNNGLLLNHSILTILTELAKNGLS